MFLEKNRREVERNCSASSRGCEYDINSRLLRLSLYANIFARGEGSPISIWNETTEGMERIRCRKFSR